MAHSQEWNIKASESSKNTVNPIRDIIDGMKIVPNPDKPMISLSIGDPTKYGMFDTDDFVNEKIIESLSTKQNNGYPPCNGTVEARAAIAEYSSVPGGELKADDVTICSGASGAIDIVINALANPGDNILIPEPGFSLYECAAGNRGVIVKPYQLKACRNWEVDISEVSSLIDNKTVAIVIINPSNPCGSVYSKEHLQEILSVAEKFKVPIIADEIYANMTFEGHPFYPIGSLSDLVPVISIGGLAKRFLVPGWRVGWILVYDYNNILSHIRRAIFSLTQVVLGITTSS